MRKIVAFGIVGLSGLVLSPVRSGATTDLETYVGAQQQSSATILNDGTPAGLKRMYQGLKMTLDPLTKNTSLSADIEIAQPNYAGVMVQRKDGSFFSLQETSPRAVEITGRLGFQVFIPQTSFGLNASAPLSPAPYASRSLGLQVQREFFEKATILTIAASLSESDSPESYWTDYEFQIQARPTRIHGNTVSGSWEQVLSEQWRTKVAVFTGQKAEERPRHIGAEAQARFALTDRLFLGAKLFVLQENDSESLKNERGYFTIGSATVSVMAEPVYDLLVHAAYSLGVEREVDPRRSYSLVVGSDQYSFGASYAAGFGTVFTQLNLLMAANADRQWSASGGVKWKL